LDLLVWTVVSQLHHRALVIESVLQQNGLAVVEFEVLAVDHIHVALHQIGGLSLVPKSLVANSTQHSRLLAFRLDAHGGIASPLVHGRF
jgi:hypothetical protein